MPQPELPNAVKERLFKVLDLERYMKPEAVEHADTQPDAASG